MLHTPSSPTDHLAENRVKFNHEKAQLNTVMGILNCYLREYAIPNQQVEWQCHSTTLPQTLKRNYTSQQLVTIHLSEQDSLLVLPVEYASRLGKVKLADMPWAKWPAQVGANSIPVNKH